MRDANFNMEALENRIENQASKLEVKFKQHIAAHTEAIKPIITDHLVQAETKLKSITQHLTNTFQLQLKNDLFTQEAKLTEYTSNFSSSIKQVFDTSTEATQLHFKELKNKLAEHAQSLQAALAEKADELATTIQTMSYDALEEIKRVTLTAPVNPLPAHATQPETTKSIRSPTMDFSFTPPMATTTTMAPAYQATSDPAIPIGTTAPTFRASSRSTKVDPAFIQKMENYTPGKAPLSSSTAKSNSYTGQQYDELPPLQYDMVIKRTSVQFSGDQDTLVFYNQLRNGLSPYGCYLKKIADIRVEETLCPD